MSKSEFGFSLRRRGVGGNVNPRESDGRGSEVGSMTDDFWATGLLVESRASILLRAGLVSTTPPAPTKLPSSSLYLHMRVLRALFHCWVAQKGVGRGITIPCRCQGYVWGW